MPRNVPFHEPILVRVFALIVDEIVCFYIHEFIVLFLLFCLFMPSFTATKVSISEKDTGMKPQNSSHANTGMSAAEILHIVI